MTAARAATGQTEFVRQYFQQARKATLLIDGDMSPKPAYEALHRLVKEKWWTRATVRTDAQGKAAFRGTLGQYRITVTSNGRIADPQSLQLRRGQANLITVRTSR